MTKIAAIRPRSPGAASRCAAARPPRSADAPRGSGDRERAAGARALLLPVRSSALFSSCSSRAVSSASSARRMLPRAVKPSPATRISSACRFAAKRLRCSSTNTTPHGSWSSARSAASLSTSRSAKRRRIRSARCRCGSSTRQRSTSCLNPADSRGRSTSRNTAVALFPREHRAQPMMQILRTKPFSVESAPHEFDLGDELITDMDCSRWSGSRVRGPATTFCRA